jgi:hypothetical protein
MSLFLPPPRRLLLYSLQPSSINVLRTASLPPSQPQDDARAHRAGVRSASAAAAAAVPERARRALQTAR